MPSRTVVVVGAGNLRCAPPVLATLASWYPDVPAEVRLFDASEERLDLFDRLARLLFQHTGNETGVRATSDLAEAVDGATDLVLCLHEDCARRMVGPREARWLDNLEAEVETHILHRGDPNRPTPASQLSRATRAMIEVPVSTTMSRDEVLDGALGLVLRQTPAQARVLSLMRGVAMPTDRGSIHLAWPAPLDDATLSRVPFQVLRWVTGDDRLDAIVEAGKANDFRDWLEA
ncbi:MAG: hypothetical protein KF857_05875 [Fimbriimonadaceae bacterium]|nr:hypothetical protein [Fimbriimonadaceae bacterium]